MTTKPCPDCQTPIKANALRCACGWKSAEAQRTSPDADDRNRCSYELLGQRCPHPWVIARNGRRYCREHDPRSGANAAALRVPGGVGDFDALRKMVDAAPPIPRRNEVKRPAHVTGPARPIGESLPQFETTDADLEAWGEGRE